MASNKQTKTKGRRSKQAVANAEEPVVDDNKPNPMPPTKPHKRGQKHATEDDVGDGAPPPKKAKGDIGVSKLPPQPVAKTAPACKKAEVVPRAALPDHQGRNVHPAVQPTKHRSSQEVAAECEAKQKAIEDKIQEGKKVKQLLAELNIAEDLEMDGDKDPQRLSAATRKHGGDVSEHASMDREVFDFMDVDEMLDSAPEIEDEEPAPKAKTVSESLITGEDST